MSKREQGFTLIELMIVVAIIAIIASIAIPNLLSARLNANESAAIATLKNISSAQAQCQASGMIDVNANGAGEYGFFGELSGAQLTRNSTNKISPPVLSSAFGNVSGSRVNRSGYIFQMYLPDDTAVAMAEVATGGDPSNTQGVDPGKAETLWCCYAWPQAQGNSGKRTFFINQGGDVLSCLDTTYGGIVGAGVPGVDAAFIGTRSGSMETPVAANTVGGNAKTWTVVN